MNSIVEQIFEKAKLYPDKIALIEGQKVVTYGSLIRNILSARYLLQTLLGVKKDDRIILAANKQLEFVYTYFAIHLLGGIVVPIDSETNPSRFDFIKHKIMPKFIIGFKCLGVSLPHVGYDYFSVIENLDVEGSISYPEPDRCADIVFTTGTTGEPKGVILTHCNITAAAYNINLFIGNNEDDLELLALPISHSFGLGRLRCVLSKGGTLILLGSFVNVKRIFRLMEEYNVSGFAMVPASWAFLRKMSGTKLGEFAENLRYIEIGSAAMPIEDKKLLISLFPNTRICMHYGLTEASRSAFIEFNSEKMKLSTIGKASPNIEIVIKDPKGNDLPTGAEGELCVKGDSVTLGYWEDEKSTIESFFGKYFRTGDWGYCDKDGYISLLSRKKELINVGGKKVSPVEVEDALNTIDGIQESACVGIADDNNVLGEVVKAYVVKSSTEELDIDVVNKQLNKLLENYKIPAVYEFVDKIPKTSSGKIQRLLLKKE